MGSPSPHSGRCRTVGDLRQASVFILTNGNSRRNISGLLKSCCLNSLSRRWVSSWFALRSIFLVLSQRDINTTVEAAQNWTSEIWKISDMLDRGRFLLCALFHLNGDERSFFFYGQEDELNISNQPPFFLCIIKQAILVETDDLKYYVSRPLWKSAPYRCFSDTPCVPSYLADSF